MRALMTGPRATTPPPDPPAPSRGCIRLRAGGQFATGGAVIELEPKDALLLAYLAVEGPTSRGRLAALLWPDVDEERARGNLRQRLMRLKRTTGAELVVGNPQATLAAGIAHDLDDGHDLLQAIEARQAAGLADWLEAQRERRRRARFDWHDAAATQAETEGDLAAALEHVSALVALDPLSEHAHRRVMKLHYLRGDSAAAIAAYERCRQMLKRELNAAPSKETEALRAAVGGTVVALPAAPARRTVPLSVLRPPRLIGRAAEWAALQAARDERRPALVLGEAGLGKTRLVTDFARAQGAAAVVSARPGDAQVVYALTARLLRQLPPEVLAALDASVRKELARLLPEFGDAMPIGSDAERARFFNAVGAALAAAAQRLDIVVVDDLHFADEASVELVQYLAADCPLHWLFAARPAELGAAARALMQAMRGKAAGTLVELAPLTPAQLLELIDSLGLDGVDAAALAPALMRQTGGNPMFALESIKAWLAQRGEGDGGRLPVAAHLGAIVERRIGRLSPEAVKLARCAAVAGQDFSAELAAHVLGVRPLDLADAWAELEHAQVFRDGAFAHDLIHEAALASVPPPIARQLHAELARFLRERGVAAARVADHCLAAELWQPAGEAMLRAAAEAGGARRWREQASLLERAIACFERTGDHAARFEALLARVDALIYCDLGTATVECARSADAAAADDAQRLRATLALLNVLTHRGETAEAIAVGRRGVTLARARADRATEVRIALPLSGNLCDRQQAGEALALLRPVHGWVEQHASASERCEFHIALGMALDQSSRLAEAISAFDCACDIARAEGLTATLSEALSNLASAQAKVGRVRRAVELGQQAVSLMRGDEPMSGRPLQSQLMLAHRLRDLGRYAEALPLLETALAAFRETSASYWTFAAAHRLALTYLQLGQPARAKRLLAPQADGQPPRGQALWAMVRAELARQSGAERADEAVRLIRHALSLLEGDPEDGAYRIVTLFATAIVPPEEGEALATALAAWANARERYGMALAAHVRAAHCALAQHSPLRALPHAEAALRLADDFEADSHYRGELWLTAGRVLRALGRAPQAAQALTAGREWIESIARQHVPPEFRDSFLNRNPVNRELLTLATRLK